MLFALAGMMLMATATDLLVIFLALEVLSLAIYVLTGIRRDSAIGSEGAFKYFLLGAFSSAFFLYGIAFIYGVDRQHAARSHRQLDGRAGDVADADATDGASACCWSALPSRCRRCRSTCGRRTPTKARRPRSPASCRPGVKAAAFAAFVRVFLSAFEPLSSHWSMLVWAIAAATMIVGTVVGVSQSSVKRMLAYSSIAHGGYLLVALVSANDVGQGRDPLLPARLRRHQSRCLRRSSACSRPPIGRTTRLQTTPGCGTSSRRWRC